jgi:hypothetical protein
LEKKRNLTLSLLLRVGIFSDEREIEERIGDAKMSDPLFFLESMGHLARPGEQGSQLILRSLEPSALARMKLAACPIDVESEHRHR